MIDVSDLVLVTVATVAVVNTETAVFDIAVEKIGSREERWGKGPMSVAVEGEEFQTTSSGSGWHERHHC